MSTHAIRAVDDRRPAPVRLAGERRSGRTSCSCSRTTCRTTWCRTCGTSRRCSDQGTSFDRYVVTDSLCCPSRASILTGRYPHSTGVITNTPPVGGFEVFHPVEEKSTFATSLQAAGYRTALMGKYLNGYTPRGMVDGAPRFVPPGWSAWAVAGNGYPDFNYNLLVKSPGRRAAQVVHYGTRPRDYLTDVISRRGQRFIAGAVADRQAVPARARDVHAARAVHARAAARERRSRTLRAPRGALFNAPQRLNPPSWLPKAPLTDAADRADRRQLPQARAVGAGDRRDDRRDPRAAAPARRGRQHLHRVQLRQRLPHGSAAAAPRASRRTSTTTSACR